MNILHLPLGATSHPTIPADAAAKPTSCEGYVTKRGHFMKSWRVRYLILNGADLSVSYFDSKEAARTPGAVPKGSFYLSSVEKHEYYVGVLGAQEKPFGFKMVGHAPRKGYVELDVFVDSLGDLNKWLEVCQNALAAAKKLTRNGQSDAATTKSLFGFSPATSPQKQIKKLAATKEEMLKQAIEEIESAKLIGREACQEIVVQGEKLDHIENELERVQDDLDFGDKLLSHMKRPMLHFFSNDTRDKPHATTHKRPSLKQSALSDATRADVLDQGDGSALATATASGTMSDIERLASLLGELEAQATLLNEEAVRGTAQVERVGDALAQINVRVQAQTKKADRAIRRA